MLSGGGGARGELGPSALTMGAELLEQAAGTGASSITSNMVTLTPISIIHRPQAEGSYFRRAIPYTGARCVFTMDTAQHSCMAT
jgi:hypothetical protein